MGTKVHDKALSYTPYHLRRGAGPFRNAAAFNDDFSQERSGECQDGFCPSILGVDHIDTSCPTRCVSGSRTAICNAAT